MIMNIVQNPFDIHLFGLYLTDEYLKMLLSKKPRTVRFSFDARDTASFLAHILKKCDFTQNIRICKSSLKSVSNNVIEICLK